MFDFSRLTDTISEIAGQVLPGNTPYPATDLVALLENAGIDPSALTGLSENEILTFLSEHGIDPSQLGEGQLAKLLSNFGLDEHVASLASSVFGDKG